MSSAQSQKPTPVGLGAFTLSHWELLALLKVLKIKAIAGQDDDGVAQEAIKRRLTASDIEMRIEVALEDLMARGFVEVVQTADANQSARPTYTVAVPTPVLSLLAVCASGWYSLRIVTMMKGAQAESYLHEWKQLGVVHGIDRESATHLFIPVANRKGILYAVSQLTDAESAVTPAPDGVTLGSIAAPIFRRIIVEAPRNGESKVRELLSSSGLNPDHQGRFAATLVHSDRFDEIGMAVQTKTGPYQANALRLKRGDLEYFCFTKYAKDDSAEFTVITGGRGAAARWVAALFKAGNI